MDKLKLIRTRPGSPGFHHFDEVAAGLYGSEKLPVNSMLNERLLHSCLVILKEDQAAGRLAYYENPDLVYKGLPAACIGNYECIPDAEVSSVLLEAARALAAERNKSWIIGPMNGSTWDTYRFTTSVSQPLFFTEHLHRDYYPGQFEAAGFGVIARYVSSMDNALAWYREQGGEWDEKMKKEGVLIRPLNLENYEHELELLYALCRETFRSNFLFTPVSFEGFREKYLPARNLLSPSCTLVAETKEGKLAGMLFCMPDFYSREKKGLVMKTVARLPGRTYAGLAQAMVNRAVKQALVENVDYIIHAFMHADNPSNNLSKQFSGRVLREYALYARPTGI